MASFINWFVDNMASEDVIDLYFILSDMVEIDLTEEETCETAYYDSMARASSPEQNHDRDIPMGRRVY